MDSFEQTTYFPVISSTENKLQIQPLKSFSKTIKGPTKGGQISTIKLFERFESLIVLELGKMNLH